MKLLFATEGETLESKIAKRFGHAPYYLIYDTESKHLEVRGNKGHSDDHAELRNLVRQGVKKFFVGNIGPYAFEVLKEEGSDIFLVRGLPARKALQEFLENNLLPLDKPTLKRSIEEH